MYSLKALLTCLCLTSLVFLGNAQVVNFSDVSINVDFDRSSIINQGDGLAGAAWLDYDLDGDMDLYLTNGRGEDNALFENDGSGNFTDVAIAAGVTNGGGSTGVIVADIDNDRYPDIFLSGDGGMMGISGDSPVKLYRNKGDGTFQDITVSSGVVGGLTTLSASFGDINNDGYVDLYITACGSLVNQQQHSNTMYLNNGDLTFTDISTSSGVATALGACISFFTDYNNDGFIDLVVGNCNDIQLDPAPIELFRNNGDNTFTDVGLPAGLEAGLWMGFAPGDFNNDGNIDFFVTNVGSSYSNPFNSSHALYKNNGDGTYENLRFDLELDTLPWGWGAVMTDLDNDGWEDIYYVGSMPLAPFNVGCATGPDARPGNPGVFLMNNGDETFEYATDDLNPTDLKCYYTSGVATGDINSDGFPDLITAVEPTAGFDGQPFLWENTGNDNHWVCIKVDGEPLYNFMGIGARVNVKSGSLDMTKEVYSGSSFLSNNSPWLTFGLGSNTTVDEVNVRWPDGTWESFPTSSIVVDDCNRLNPGGIVGISTPVSYASSATLDIYPNPTNGRSSIAINAPRPGNGWITITNATGQIVRILETGSLIQGEQVIQFDGLDEQGNGLPNGLYIHTLTMTGSVQPVSASMVVSH